MHAYRLFSCLADSWVNNTFTRIVSFKFPSEMSKTTSSFFFSYQALNWIVSLFFLRNICSMHVHGYRYIYYLVFPQGGIIIKSFHNLLNRFIIFLVRFFLEFSDVEYFLFFINYNQELNHVQVNSRSHRAKICTRLDAKIQSTTKSYFLHRILGK